MAQKDWRHQGGPRPAEGVHPSATQERPRLCDSPPAAYDPTAYCETHLTWGADATHSGRAGRPTCRGAVGGTPRGMGCLQRLRKRATGAASLTWRAAQRGGSTTTRARSRRARGAARRRRRVRLHHPGSSRRGSLCPVLSDRVSSRSYCGRRSRRALLVRPVVEPRGRLES